LGDLNSLAMFSLLGCDQLPLSLAVGLWLSCCTGLAAYRLRKGQAWPLRLRWGPKFDPLPSFWPGRWPWRLAFGSFASWIIDDSLIPESVSPGRQ
jgi:hypothetical protein